MATEKETQGFGGWNSSGGNDVDFFGSGGPEIDRDVAALETEPATKITDEVLKDDVDLEAEDEGDKPDTTAEAGDDDHSFFGTQGEEEDLTDDDEDVAEAPAAKKKPAVATTDIDDEEEATAVGSIALLNAFKEKGFAEFELEDGQELTADLAEDMLDDAYDLAVENRMRETLKSLPKDLVELNLLAIKGGDISKFIAGKATSLTTGMDMSNKTDAEKVISETLRSQGRDQEYIDDQIEFLTTKNKLENFAKAEYTKWEKTENARIKNEAELTAKNSKIARENLKRQKKEQAEFLAANKSIKDFPISRQLARQLPSYMSDSTVSTGDGRSVTPLIKDLQDVMRDPEKSLLLAAILKSGFDFKSLVKKGATKNTRKVKEEIRRQEGIKPSKTASGSSHSGGGSLADMF
jgi:hypothetical protein